MRLRFGATARRPSTLVIHDTLAVLGVEVRGPNQIEGADRMTHLINRRTVIGGALVAALPFPDLAQARGMTGRDGLLVLLLKGPYKPVVHAPNLG